MDPSRMGMATHERPPVPAANGWTPRQRDATLAEANGRTTRHAALPIQPGEATRAAQEQGDILPARSTAPCQVWAFAESLRRRRSRAAFTMDT